MRHDNALNRQKSETPRRNRSADYREIRRVLAAAP
jgi:hypothetical protein